MDNHQTALLELVKNALFKTPLDIPEDIDWDALYEESVNQTVVSLIAGSVPKEHSARFEGTRLRYRAQYMKILFEQNMLAALLSENHIPMMIIKGIGAARYYPVPADRVMGDIDVLVPVGDYERAKDLLLNHQYSFDHEDENRHAAYFKNGICIELHFCFSTDCPELNDYLTGSFSDIQTLEINGFRFPILPEAVNGLLILAHIRHHILADGLGLRHLTDWEMFVHAHPDADFWRGTFLPMAEACGLTDFATIVTRLCGKYLALPDDISWCGDVDAPRLAFIMDYVLKTGNFGIKTAEEVKPVERVSLNMKKAINNKSFFKMLQENGLTNWKACRKYPFLRPFAFIYQAFRYLFRGIKVALRGGVFKDFGKANTKFEIYKAFELNK